MKKTINNIYENLISSWIIIATIAMSLIVFACAARYNDLFNEMMSITTYLTWHNLFEFFGIIASFSIFIVTYYTYQETGSLRMILLGCAFLVMGALDTFHALSFKGMADFFIANTSSNRATTFWILSRTIGSLGVLIAVFIPIYIKSIIKKWVFVIPTFIIVMGSLFVVTYYHEFFPAMFIEGRGLTQEKIIMEYIVVLFMGITLIKVACEYRKTRFRQDSMFMIGIVLSIFSEFAFVSYASVYDAYNYLGHIYKFIAYFIMFNVIYTENVRMPYREMKKARNELKDYSENLNFLVQQRTKAFEDLNSKLLMDLEYARDLQQSLLPSKMPENMSVSFEAGYLPADRLSGDFYNVIKLDENNIAIYIGDVAGHGVPAAMLMVFANQNIKPIKEIEDTIEIITPDAVLNSLFNSFNNTNFSAETYMVMLYGVYNTKNRVFTYASGGINVQPLIIKHTGEIIEMDVDGFAICKLGDIITPVFEDRKIQLERGDKILFYTDGLVEAENLNGQKYTEKHLFDFLKGNPNLRGPGIADAIRKDFFKYVGNEGKLKDDVTFLVMEVS